VEIQVISLEEAFAEADAGQLQTLFELAPDVVAGVFVFRPGQRTPEEGFSAHDGTEISIVLSGEVQLVLKDGQEHHVRAGDIVMIPKGIPHYSRNNGEAEARIFWTLAPVAASNHE